MAHRYEDDDEEGEAFSFAFFAGRTPNVSQTPSRCMRSTHFSAARSHSPSRAASPAARAAGGPTLSSGHNSSSSSVRPAATSSSTSRGGPFARVNAGGSGKRSGGVVTWSGTSRSAAARSSAPSVFAASSRWYFPGARYIASFFTASSKTLRWGTVMPADASPEETAVCTAENVSGRDARIAKAAARSWFAARPLAALAADPASCARRSETRAGGAATGRGAFSFSVSSSARGSSSVFSSVFVSTEESFGGCVSLPAFVVFRCRLVFFSPSGGATNSVTIVLLARRSPASSSTLRLTRAASPSVPASARLG
mmetsp:Transcript_2985/g.11880  ORF Transcript_2985/g.11880 Transcript_2985/m.11880 type:complete len:311 (+) Transcript_2985:1640-2572(+)